MTDFLRPIAQWTYDVNKSFSKSRNSPFDGHDVPGRSGGDDRGRRNRLAGLKSERLTDR